MGTQEPVEVSEDLPVEELVEEDDFDVGRALEELLVDDGDVLEEEKAIVVAPLSVASDASQVTPEVTEQFNRLTDVIISKVNSALRSKKLDPLSLNFQKNKQNKRKNKNAKKNARKRKRQRQRKSKKNRRTRDVTDIEEKEDELEFEEVEIEGEGAVYVADEEFDDEEEKDEDNESERVKRQADDGEDAAMDEEEGDARRLNNKNRKKSPKKSKGKGKSKSKGKPKGKKSKKNKRKSRRRRTGAIVGVLSGLSSLKRVGDVIVQGEPGNSDIVADFTAGPVNLVAIRKLGKGKKQRRSKATVNELKGRMIIRFSEGSSQISDIILYKPDDVAVDGALTKGKKKKTNSIMMKKVRQVNPIVATKLKQVTRDVLQTIRIQ